MTCCRVRGISWKEQVLFEYKVLTERDSVFAARFDPASLETALNSYAGQRWRVIETFLAASLWRAPRPRSW